MKIPMLIAAGCYAAFGAVHPCPAQTVLARPTITKLPNGATRVINSGPSQWADTNGWKLVYERTVQPPEGAPGGLENPWGAVLAPNGQLITIDFKNAAVRSYDAQGKYLRAFGRLGEGPGEFKVPFIALYKDSVFLYDPQLRRATVMTLGGTVVRTIVTTANDQFPIHFDNRGFMALRVSVGTPTGRVGRWVYHDRTGRRIDSIAALGYFSAKGWPYTSHEGPSEWPIPFPPSNVEQLLPTGGALVGRTDQYAIVVTRTGLDTVRTFSRLNPPKVAIPNATRDSAFQAQIRDRPFLRSAASLSDLPTSYPLWRSLHLDAAGNFWVWARSADPARSRFDVFTRDGVFLGSVAAPFGSASKPEFHGDRVTVIDTDGDDLPRIRIYRIDRRGP